MMLQNFATSVIETLGGVVEPLEYALCMVLIPEEYKSVFQDKAEMLLAFDFEVAEENPSAEFVTFGSFILDKLIELVNEKTISIVRYVIIDYLKVVNPQEKIKKFLGIDRGVLKIVSEKKVTGCFAAFHFNVGLSSDERIEEHRELWVDLITHRIATDMLAEKSSMFYEEHYPGTYHVPQSMPVIEAFEIAYADLKKDIEVEKLKYQVDFTLNNEIKRIEEYYNELKKENQKKIQRKGITQEKIRELKSKEETLVVECEHQLKQMYEKYTIKTDIGLENGVLYFMPLIEYTVTLTSSNILEEKRVYYNGITKKFYTRVQ